MHATEKGKVLVYALGGCGTNIGSLLEKHRNQSEVAFAEIEIVYIDTSKSNIHKGIDAKHCYMLEGLDGSGKIRKENHEEINNHIKSILQHFKPANLNIVLSSAGGGSGAIFAPLIMRELLSSGAAAIALTVGSADTRLDAENTLKTIKSYESIAKMVDAPVIMSYVQNGQNVSRADADSALFDTVMSLAILFSRENRELDTKDLSNWLRFNKATTFPVQLASLTLVENKTTLKDLGNIISVATLAKDGMSTALIELPEYQCVGYFPEGTSTNITEKAPLHFVISDGVIPVVAKDLQKILSNLEAQQEARLKTPSLVTGKDKQESSGVIL
jgi:hypothetical protein